MTANTAMAVRAMHGEGSPNEFHRRSVAALHAAEGSVPDRRRTGGNDLDESLHHGTRTIRRRRHRSHLLCCAAEIDWPHLVRRFGPDWRVLLNHLILFGYIYPGERARIPVAVMEGLITRLRSETNNAGPERLCRGTLLSRQQYLVDVQEWGFRDARLEERVQMNEQDIANWTDAIGKQE